MYVKLHFESLFQNHLYSFIDFYKITNQKLAMFLFTDSHVY